MCFMFGGVCGVAVGVVVGLDELEDMDVVVGDERFLICKGVREVVGVCVLKEETLGVAQGLMLCWVMN